MALTTYTYEQLGLDTGLEYLTDKEKKALEKSWAAAFAAEIFPCIDERIFRPLFSETISKNPSCFFICAIECINRTRIVSHLNRSALFAKANCLIFQAIIFTQIPIQSVPVRYLPFGELEIVILLH